MTAIFEQIYSLRIDDSGTLSDLLLMVILYNRRLQIHKFYSGVEWQRREERSWFAVDAEIAKQSGFRPPSRFWA